MLRRKQRDVRNAKRIRRDERGSSSSEDEQASNEDSNNNDGREKRDVKRVKIECPNGTAVECPNVPMDGNMGGNPTTMDGNAETAKHQGVCEMPVEIVKQRNDDYSDEDELSFNSWTSRMTGRREDHELFDRSVYVERKKEIEEQRAGLPAAGMEQVNINEGDVVG